MDTVKERKSDRADLATACDCVKVRSWSAQNSFAYKQAGQPAAELQGQPRGQHLWKKPKEKQEVRGMS